MLNFFPVALILLFIIFQFTLTAGFNTASAGAAGGGEGGGGGGGGEEDGRNGLSGASISDDSGPKDDVSTSNPSIRYNADASQSGKYTPSENNKNHGCRAEALGPNNFNRMQRKQARDVKNGFCANDNSLPLLTTTEQQQQGQPPGAKRPEAIFPGGQRKRPDPGLDPGDFFSREDNGEAALFSPTENPNICKSPSHPIPVCHKLVPSFSGDLDHVIFELPRCYPLNLLGGCDLPKILFCCATAYLDPVDGLWVGFSCILTDPNYLPDPLNDRLDTRPSDNWDF